MIYFCKVTKQKKLQDDIRVLQKFHDTCHSQNGY